MPADPVDRGPLVPSDKTADRIASLYRVVEEKIQDEIDKAIASGQLNRAAYLQERRAAIYGLLVAAEGQAAAAVAIEIRNSYAKAGSATFEILKEAGVETMREAFDLSDTDRINILVENATSKYNDITRMVGRRTDDIFRQVALEQITANQGRAYTETAEAIERALIRAGVTKTSAGGVRLVNIGGRNLQLAKYAEMVARTTPREASSIATVAKITKAGRDLVTITSHSGSCPICGPYDGQTFSLSGSSGTYPLLDRLPPFHPNCRHSMGSAAIF